MSPQQKASLWRHLFPHMQAAFQTTALTPTKFRLEGAEETWDMEWCQIGEAIAEIQAVLKEWGEGEEADLLEDLETSRWVPHQAASVLYACYEPCSTWLALALTTEVIYEKWGNAAAISCLLEDPDATDFLQSLQPDDLNPFEKAFWGAWAQQPNYWEGLDDHFQNFPPHWSWMEAVQLQFPEDETAGYTFLQSLAAREAWQTHNDGPIYNLYLMENALAKLLRAKGWNLDQIPLPERGFFGLAQEVTPYPIWASLSINL